MTSLLTDHLISSLIAVPFVGIAAILLVRGRAFARWCALASSLVALGLGLALWSGFDKTVSGMQFVERVEWMPTFNIHYAVGVDGISLVMVLLTALLTPLCVLASWTSIESKARAFMSLVLLVEGAMIVVFTAMDLFLFFMLWEVTMIPMYFMIVLWGGPERIRAGIKFVLYSLTGSLLLLAGIFGLYLHAGRTFDLQAIVAHGIPGEAQTWIFVALFLGFAIKLPMIPFHSWLPDAHSEAPTAGSVILAGVLLKMGGYGFLRICLPALPEASDSFAPAILWLSIGGILYGGCLALAQSDLKRLVAYSSISHMGFVTLGIFAFNEQGIQGSVMQMFAHGVSTGRRTALRPDPQPVDQRLRRTAQLDAPLRRDAVDLRHRLVRPAGDRELRRRVPRARGHLLRRNAQGPARDGRHRARRRLHALDAAARRSRKALHLRRSDAARSWSPGNPHTRAARHRCLQRWPVPHAADRDPGAGGQRARRAGCGGA